MNCRYDDEPAAVIAIMEGYEPAPTCPRHTNLRDVEPVLAFLCAPLPCTGCRTPMRHDPTRNIVAYSGLPPYVTRSLFHQNCWYDGVTR